MSTDSKDRVAMVLSKIENSGLGARPFPIPEEEMLLASISKKRGSIDLRILFHRRKEQRYVVIAAYELEDRDWILMRWVAINGPELGTVINALMDGFELVYNIEQNGSASIEFPHLLCALPRKDGTRELRITLEQFKVSVTIKLRVHQKDGNAWRWGDEWSWLYPNDLSDVLPALLRAQELIEAGASEK